MNLINLPSPNHDSRDGQNIDMLVLHYTGMKTGEEACARLIDPEAKVSAHYVIEENGDIYRLVDESMRAWHAGVSYWRSNTNINQRSIGIEIVNPGHEFGYRRFPERQMQSVADLCREILSRHDIPARNVVAHSDIAPTRKEDPGELFDWKFLASQGIGLWPKEQRASLFLAAINRFLPFKSFDFTHPLMGFRRLTDAPLYAAAAGDLPTDAQLSEQLATYGYDTTNLPKTILAFQRRFYPNRLTGKWDRECALRLATLRKML